MPLENNRLDWQTSESGLFDDIGVFPEQANRRVAHIQRIYALSYHTAATIAFLAFGMGR
jgi:hypothetical protein